MTRHGPGPVWHGAGVGGAVGCLVNVLIAFGLGALAIGTALLLLVCMGMANAMSVNNVTSQQLLLDWLPTWWEFFGDASTQLAVLAALVGLVAFVGCTALGMVLGAGWRWFRATRSPTGGDS